MAHQVQNYLFQTQREAENWIESRKAHRTPDEDLYFSGPTRTTDAVGDPIWRVRFERYSG